MVPISVNSPGRFFNILVPSTTRSHGTRSKKENSVCEGEGEVWCYRADDVGDRNEVVIVTTVNVASLTQSPHPPPLFYIAVVVSLNFAVKPRQGN